MKMNVWHFLISYQFTSLLPCKVFLLYSCFKQNISNFYYSHQGGKAKEELHLLKEVFDLFKKVPERVLNLWESSSLCSSWRWPARLVENPPRGLASPRLHGESNFCNSCGQQQERTSFQCGWKRGDPKAKSVGSWKSRELCHCKDKPLAVERDGSKKIYILSDFFSFKSH